MALSERTVIVGIVLLTVAKALVAVSLPLLGDEAFYRWESLRPALGYSDLPPMTAWFLALTALPDGGYFGVRWAFLLLGAALPLAVYALAREFWPRREALVAALGALAMPLVALQGLLAVPDVLINLCAVLLALGVVRGIGGERGGWLLAAVALAVGLATHPRFLLPALAAGLAVLASSAGRRSLRVPGPWLAAAGAGLGLLPTVLFSLSQGGAMLSFQFEDRHPWRFQAEGLLQPVAQALTVTPILYGLLIAAAVVLLRQRRDDARWRVLAWVGLLPLLLYFVLGLFADQERVGFHWPLTGYLPLCVALPLLHSSRVARRLAVPAAALGAMATIGLLALLAALARWPDRDWPARSLLPVNFVGWPEVAAVLPDEPGPLVADNFMLGAQLAFETDRRSVHVLDHPRNRKHGRAEQLRTWDLDEAAIPDGPGTLVIEEDALPFAEQPAWARRVCRRFPDATPVADVTLLAGRRRFRVFRYGEGEAGCDHAAFGYVDEPAAGESVSASFTVRGWAFDDDDGLGRIEVLLDGLAVAEAGKRTPRADVVEFFEGVHDPDQPRLGFEAEVTGVAAGPRLLQLRLTGRDGQQRITAPVRIRVTGP